MRDSRPGKFVLSDGRVVIGYVDLVDILHWIDRDNKGVFGVAGPEEYVRYRVTS